MNRSQHVIGSGVVFAVGLWVTWVSYTQQPAEAFLFPRLIASVFVVLAGWTFGKAVMGLSKVGNGMTRTMFINMMPGLIVTLIYVFWAAKSLGFYTATAITFFALLSIYDPASHSEAKTWVKRGAITAIFVTVMYGLFAMLLNVYTPREILF
ncbi:MULTISPECIES: tripartite tricarboxylate transporter TctB family protein [unclassified Ruegeria]|uniref:tripartite tricarboxylate transporter TctB family protein n=1 Tax=unclassified Ruegeria TaxID=2625375 RepID=UPI001487AAAB|nr:MULTISPECIES: tripartite tricarboxylate transporter TctB family protein [unclassified Ruegeria]NOD35751.1 tripartite tricarboxylate transporter TctB family protein [Ruegeria sp. HKCCD7296]NOE34316.1 tripartite tricarboxylate transporter TctB family protein [Ruegeria sp. HKCCD7318]NOE40202.1 tripartite tricarboxylate transporter TctB family protein [Ruegeria sp. HKCCD7319]